MIRAAAATHEVMAEAAQTVLDAGADAADALVAGFFALAGATPAGLLAPTVAMLGGTGVGGRVFDGRALQPGRGAPRPRGFLEGAEIPLGAYVAVPGFDLALGLHATPVLRGVPRVPPGSPRRAPFGLALALHEQVSAALAVGVASLLDPQEVGELLLGSSFDGLAVALRQRTAGAVAGVLSDGRAARVF